MWPGIQGSTLVEGGGFYLAAGQVSYLKISNTRYTVHRSWNVCNYIIFRARLSKCQMAGLLLESGLELAATPISIAILASAEWVIENTCLTSQFIPLLSYRTNSNARVEVGNRPFLWLSSHWMVMEDRTTMMCQWSMDTISPFSLMLLRWELCC